MTDVLPALVDQADIPKVYGRVAPLYDLVGRFAESHARERCLELARPRDGETILEVAVGTGLTFETLTRANPAGITEGIDLTEAMLSHARRRVAAKPGRHRLAVGDAHQLGFEAGHTARGSSPTGGVPLWSVAAGASACCRS